MKFELSQRFYFDAAHTLLREIETEGSKRIHGHTYEAEVTISGAPDPATGMILDLGRLKTAIAAVRDLLDHHLLDEVAELGIPTLENICVFISKKIEANAIKVHKISVWRNASGDRCEMTQD